MIEVPFLTEAQIEAKADALLGAFSRDREPILEPPVPLEDKLLYYLGLRLHMDDLHARFGVPRIAGRTDILAALWIEDREIRVDESLDPEENPKTEGRYHFSIGHEVGHWELHRHHILATSAEPHLLVQSSSPIVCRNSDLNGGRSRKERDGTRQQRDARARMELQANRFGACLLMPGFLIQAAWRQRFNNLDPVFVEDRQSFAPELRLLLPSAVPGHEVSATPIAHRAIEELITDFAAEFRTSRHAMRIRLHNLGLIFP
jgi:hypothetical protein